MFFLSPRINFQAKDIVQTLEAEAKEVEYQLSRVGYTKYTEKVCLYADMYLYCVLLSALLVALLYRFHHAGVRCIAHEW